MQFLLKYCRGGPKFVHKSEEGDENSTLYMRIYFLPLPPPRLQVFNYRPCISEWPIVWFSIPLSLMFVAVCSTSLFNLIFDVI